MLQEPQVVGAFGRALGDAGERLQHKRVVFAAVRLPGDRDAGGEAHFTADQAVQLQDLFMVAMEELQKAGLGAGSALGAQQFQRIDAPVQLIQVQQQVMGPQRGPLAYGGELRGLEMREAQSRKGAVLPREVCQGFQNDLDLVPDGEESVHYVLMPESDPSVIDTDLEERMALAQKATSMVLALRRKVSIKVRQPLSKLVIPVISDKVRSQLEQVKGIILGEVNVKEAEFISDTTGIITKKIKPNFKTLGKVYGKQMKEIAGAFASLDQTTISAIQNAQAAGSEYVLSLPSGDVTLGPADYEISSEDMPGWLVATEGPLTIALDVQVTEELKKEGVARELINRIQNLRKDSGFDVTDKIEVIIFADGNVRDEVESALRIYNDYVSAQTLALSIEIRNGEDAPKGAVDVEWDEGVLRMVLSRV